ncbi:MAG TPA: hypothetical protein VF624_10595 [Tepidisphaeraceae bacterium]
MVDDLVDGGAVDEPLARRILRGSELDGAEGVVGEVLPVNSVAPHLTGLADHLPDVRLAVPGRHVSPEVLGLADGDGVCRSRRAEEPTDVVAGLPEHENRPGLQVRTARDVGGEQVVDVQRLGRLRGRPRRHQTHGRDLGV